MSLQEYIQKKLLDVNNEQIDCFGVTFNTNDKPEVKCYTHVKKKISGTMINAFVSDNENIIRCDYKIQNNIKHDTKKLLKFVRHQIKYKGDTAWLIKLLDLSQQYNNKLNLMELGNRFDSSNMTNTLRAYFSIRLFDNLEDFKGKFVSYENNTKLLNDIYTLFELQADIVEFVDKKAALLGEFGYYPVMLGFQEIDATIEKKIYFELHEPDKHIMKFPHSNLCLIDKILPITIKHWNENIIETILSFWHNGFFLRGIAFGIKDNESTCSFRLYFSLLEHFME